VTSLKISVTTAGTGEVQGMELSQAVNTTSCLVRWSFAPWIKHLLPRKWPLRHIAREGDNSEMPW